MSRITWSLPNGDWGVEGVELTKLPPNAYGALCKLKRMEDMIEQINRPGIPGWLKEDITEELIGGQREGR